MTRIEEIQNTILTRIAGDADLSDMNSTSKVAIYRLIAYVVSVSIWSLEELFSIFKKEQSELAASQKIHHRKWYQKQALKFQDGVDLVWEDDMFSYPESDDLDTLQKIKRCAIIEAPGELLIKIATDTDVPVANDVKLRFESYMNQIKDAGNKIRIISNPPDEIMINMDVYINPLLINENGFLVSDPSIKPVEVAIIEYVSNLDFDGAFSPTKMVDLIQQKVGVINPVYKIAVARYGVQQFEEIGDYYICDAGYLKVVEMNINYISKTI